MTQEKTEKGKACFFERPSLFPIRKTARSGTNRCGLLTYRQKSTKSTEPSSYVTM